MSGDEDAAAAPAGSPAAMSFQWPRPAVAFVAFTVALVALLTGAGRAGAAFPPPANDDFDHATTIGRLPFSVFSATVSATTAPDDPKCNGRGHTVWFRFTPQADVHVIADTFGSSYETTLSVYTGTRGHLTQLGCAGTPAEGQNLDFQATAGTTYYLMAGSVDHHFARELVF